MAYWDGKKNKIVYFDDSPYPGHPGWWYTDCGCCNGVEWGGDSPRECKSCNGSGSLALHKPSGRIAHYPGGPFVGRMPLHGEGR